MKHEAAVKFPAQANSETRLPPSVDNKPVIALGGGNSTIDFYFLSAFKPRQYGTSQGVPPCFACIYFVPAPFHCFQYSFPQVGIQ